MAITVSKITAVAQALAIETPIITPVLSSFSRVGKLKSGSVISGVSTISVEKSSSGIVTL